MTNLRSAAERLLQGELLDSHDGYELRRGPSPDVKLVAETVLAEHPADDDEPADAKWFLALSGVNTCGEAFRFSIGNSRHGQQPLVLEFLGDSACIAEDCEGGSIVVLSGTYTTRRQVRQLLESLGGGMK